MWNPLEMALSKPKMFVQEVQANSHQDAKLLTYAVACNKRIFLNKGSR
jgi:hypothetical protein